jgi:hypothetical protein
VLCRGNLDVLDWELSAADYAALSTLPFQQRMVNGAMWLVSAALRCSRAAGLACSAIGLVDRTGGEQSAAILSCCCWKIDDGGWLGNAQICLLMGPRDACASLCAALQNPKGPYTSMEELWDEPELD